MARADDTELIDAFEEFYRSYYRNEIAELAQKYPNEQKSLYIDWSDLYRFDSDLADDFRNKPKQLREYAEEALRLYDLPVDVSLGQAHVRLRNLPETTEIREIRSDHRGMLIAIQGIVRKATDVRPKITTAAFECQRCGTLSRIPQEGGDFQEPHECQGCERQGPFRINYDQSEFIDAQKLRVQESPEGLRGGETPQSIDVNIEDDITGEVTPGDHVTTTGILNLEQQGNDREKSPMFDVYMEGLSVEIEDEQFEEMDISEEDKKEIIELSNQPNIYEEMVGAIAPSIYGYEMEKKAMIFQLFSGVTKFLPDDSRTRGDLHILLIGDPGTGKCLKGDTTVTLADGRRKQIGELVENNLDDPKPVDDGVYDTVDIPVPSLTDDGQIETRRATKVWKREAPEQMYQITTERGRTLEVTPSHPLFVQSDGEFVPRQAEELAEGDEIAASPERSALTDGGCAVPGSAILTPGSALTDRSVVVDRIESIEPVEPDYDWVYDLEVADTHNYVSNGIISHNSQLLQYIKNIAPRSVYTSGKGSSAAGLCVTGETRVHTPDGEHEIRALVESELPEPVSTETAVESNTPVYTFDPEQDCFEIRETSHFWRMPKKYCRRIRTDSGRTLEATVETPVLVDSTDGTNWKQISTVESGDTVAVREGKTEHADTGVTGTAPATDGGSLVWETVVEAVDTGEKEVFDLTVPETHNFVGNGIVTHNTAAAVRDDFGEGQQWTLEAGALVLADQGIAAVDELDKMRCVTGDTLVHTPDGITPIRELAETAKQSGEIEELPNGKTIRGVDTTVWTMTDEGTITSQSVTAVHEYDAPEELREVTLESGESITTTADHPFFVLSDGERTTKPAEELREGDWAYVPRSIPGPTTDGGTSVSTIPDSGHSQAITPAHGAILGYIAGDGNIYYSREDGSYGIRFTNSEEELLSEFEGVCREAFPQSRPARYPSEKRDDGVETVRLHGKQYADELLDCGLNLETYEGKRIPEQVTAGDRDTKISFVRALADSEGTVTERSVKIYSASYELLLGTKMLLSEFAVTSQIQTRERDSGRDLYILAITSDDSLRAFADHIGFTLTRKQQALDRACERTTGTRTILDVLPECPDRFATARESLRLYQSECGLTDSTYCNFENGDANFSLQTARTVITNFKNRKETAQDDLDTLSTPQQWDVLDAITHRYHVSQEELAEGTTYSQQQISRLWGHEEALRSVVQDRLRELIEAVADTQLGRLQTLVRSDVKWRRVDSVETVTDTERVRPDIQLAKNRLARLLDCPIPAAVREAETLLHNEPHASDWNELDAELRQHELSYQDLADRFDVAGSTVSRWFRETVDGNDFETVRSVAFDLIEAKRRRIREIRTEIAERTEPKVYDLTVDGTHNFVANGAIIHNSEDQSAMHQALEQQSISVSKAGINATLKSRCSLLGAANPTYGRFDEYEPIGEQIDLTPPLISRFDLIFTVTDKPDAEKDAELAEHILQTNYAGELNTHRTETSASNYTKEEVERITDDVAPTIEPDLLRKYVAYAQRNCYPTMTEDAKSAIQQYYVDLRTTGDDEDAPVPVTARKLEALVRLSEASARVRLSDTVEESDAQRAIDIAQYCLEDIGLDPETGELDADMIETGTSKSQRDRIKNIKQLISTIEAEYDEGAPVEIIIERAEEEGMDQSKAEHEIEKLKQKGEVYEPQQNHLRTT